MKILCLHGRGSSATIFKSQTASFRQRVSSNFEFEFADGGFPSTPAADIPLFYSPPYYSFWKENDLESIHASHEWLKTKILRDGPYSGVLLFSQGCALIASFMLYWQRSTPELAPPFRFAMFICGGIPLDVMEDLGLQVSQEAHDLDLRTKHQLHEKTHAVAFVRPGTDRWEISGDATKNPLDVLESNNIFGLDVSQVTDDLTIKIPTVHVFGSKDPRYPASIQLARFCRPENRRIYDHGGGHDIPRTTEVSKSLAELLERCYQEAVDPIRER